jgi:hypothetical protein
MKSSLSPRQRRISIVIRSRGLIIGALSMLILILGLNISTEAQLLPVPVDPQIHTRAAQQGYVPVIARLDVKYRPESSLNPTQAKRQRRRLTEFRQELLRSIAGEDIVLRSGSDRWMIPYIALWVTPKGLRKLERTSRIVEIVEDIPSRPSLTGSLVPTDTYEAHNLGFTGLDQVIAVVDSGINKNHPMLSEVIVDEICFSEAFPLVNLTSLCPNGGPSQLGSGAASSAKCNNISLCDHGSFMSGIIAGAPYTTAGQTYKGISFGAKILAVQVYIRSANPAYCIGQSTPCIVALEADQFSALQRIYDTRGRYNLAAVVLGYNEAVLGTPGACTDFRTSLIRDLFNVGIATIVPSGNASNTTKIGPPACVAEAIAVGATNDSHNIASFSNSSNLVDLLAIGVDVQSAGSGISIIEADGTSAAAAQVAAAWAILKQARPNAEVNVILDALQTTGISKFDTRNGQTHKFIQVGEALKLLQTIPYSANLIMNPGFESGSGTIATSWTKKGNGASRICGAANPLVYAGACAAQLTYNGKASSFQQTFVQSAGNANYAWMAARINTFNAAGTIAATLVGSDGKTDKMKLAVAGTGTYRLLSNTFPLKNQTYTITIKMTITKGKYEVDDLYLSFQNTTASIP